MTQQIPLHLRIKKETHRKIAHAQDLILKEVYAHFNDAVLHGGTAIWRCYSGKRFSEGLDFYLPRSIQKFDDLFSSLEKSGFRIMRKKVGERSLYSELEINRVSVRLEATFQNVKGQICDYENADSNITAVYSLGPEQFVKQKVAIYLKRFLARDLYDIFFLLKLADPDAVRKELAALIKEYKKPVDEQNLKAIILEGLIPTAQEMIDYIKRKWEKPGT